MYTTSEPEKNFAEFFSIHMRTGKTNTNKIMNIPIVASAEVLSPSLLDVHHNSPISKPRPAHEI